MKKLCGAVLSAVMIFVVVSAAFAAENTPSILYEGGYVQDVLTVRQPSPWNIVKHYVGDNSKLIALILTEQGIRLNSHAKFSVGMAVRVPQKYVRKELLPSPSAAEKMLVDLKYQAELKKQVEQAELFLAKLKIRDTQIVGHWIFDGALIIAMIFLLRFHSKSVKTYNAILDYDAVLDKENQILQKALDEMTAKKSAETKKVWTPDEIKDALMKLTLRETRDLLEWEAITVQREGGGESQIKLKNVPNFLKGKDENLFDIPLQRMSDHIPQSDRVASASTKKPA